MSDVFISYSREDLERVRSLVALLEKGGLTVFWDQEIRKGELWRRKVEDELRAAKCVVVLWSRHSVRSDWVADEAEEGKRRGTLVPVKIDDVETPLGFGGLQFAAITQWPPSNRHPEVIRVLQAVSEIVGKPISEPESRAGREEVAFDRLSQAEAAGELSEIMRGFQEMVAADPEDGEGHYRLALCYLHLKLYERAAEHFKRAVERLPADAEANYYLGLSSIGGKPPRTLSLGQVREIEQCLETALQLDSRPAKYYLLLAILKHDYYLANGLKAPPPSPDHLILKARQKNAEPGEIERLLKSVTIRDEDLILSIRG